MIRQEMALSISKKRAYLSEGKKYFKIMLQLPENLVCCNRDFHKNKFFFGDKKWAISI